MKIQADSQLRIQDFLEGMRKPQTGYRPIYRQLHENERKWTKGGTSLTPHWIRQLSWLLQLRNHLYFLLYLRTRQFMSLFADSITLGCQITFPNIGVHIGTY